ncbi:MAG TPA: alkaline phosphatase family protein [Actinomycetota bacterium]
MSHRVSRRRFLKRAAIAGGAVAATGAGAFGISELLSNGERRPSPAGVDTRWPVKHVVYLMLENRSFNHLFGAYPGVSDGTRVGVVAGKEVPLITAPEWLPGDLPHDRAAALIDVHGGRMDGFAMYTKDNVPAVDFAMSLHERDTMANWWHWAENFVLCDRFFASANSASYPNHLYMIAGTSGGAFDNPEQTPQMLKSRRDRGLAKTWGCDAPEGAKVVIQDYETGKIVPGTDDTRPCFTFDTQGQQLSRKHVDWAFYAANERETGYIWNAYTAIDGVFNTELWDDHIRDVDVLVRDIKANRLPSVTWVTPRYELSDHPPYSTIWAQNWATQVINAIMRSPMWRSTAIFVTWDEWGGTYDSVEPPRVDALGLGVRVPMLVISPWANRGMIDHEVGEFSSPNRFIADNFDLDHLTDRVRNTHNFEHVFDFHRPTKKLLAPDPLPPLNPGPLPPSPPADNIGWPPAITAPGFSR